MSFPDIKAFIMDVDGVLTDGRIGYGCGSDNEIKFFDVKDGLRIKLLKDVGIVVAVLSGRQSLANRRRMQELGIEIFMESCKDKCQGMRELCDKLGIEPEQCLYIGDDLIDVAPIRMAGIGVAVADAADEAKAEADWIMTHDGGRGAVGEAVEKLLKSMQLWEKAIVKFTRN